MIAKTTVPNYRHLCDNCRYIGYVKRSNSIYDVYCCGPNHVIVRYGNGSEAEAFLRKGYLHPHGFVCIDKSVAREALLLATNTAPEQLYLKEV